MHSDIVELAYQLRRQVWVIGNVAINFFISSGSYLQIDFHFNPEPHAQVYLLRNELDMSIYNRLL